MTLSTLIFVLNFPFILIGILYAWCTAGIIRGINIFSSYCEKVLTEELEIEEQQSPSGQKE